MAIENPVLLGFLNESLRPAADRLAGLLTFPKAVISTAVGKGLIPVLGSDEATLTRPEEWTMTEYAAALTATSGEQSITGSDSGGRTLLSNLDALKMLRVIVWLNSAISADPALAPLIYKFAVNPRA